MSIRTKTARGAKWQLIELASRQALSLVVFAALTRLLAPSAFGLVGVVSVYLSFIALFAEQGMGSAIVQRKDLDPAHLDSAFWLNVIFSGLLCSITFMFALPLASFLGTVEAAPMLRWTAPLLLINGCATVQTALFIRKLDFRTIATRTLLSNMAGAIAGIGLALFHGGVWALVAQQLVTALFGTIFLWVSSNWRPRFRFSLTHFKDLMHVSGAIFATSILWFVSSRADQVFVGRFLGSTLLGQYVIGSKFADIARISLFQPMGTVALSALSRMQGDSIRINRATYQGMTLNAVLSFPLLVGLAAVAKDIVPLAFGQQWTIAATVLQLMAIYVLTLGIQTFYYPLLLVTGGPGAYVWLNILHAIGTIGSCLLAVNFGLTTVVIGLIVNNSLIGVLAFAFLMRRANLSTRLFWKPCLWPALASTVMYMVVCLTREEISPFCQLLPRVLLEVICGAFVYLVIIWRHAPETYQLAISFVRHAIGKDRTVISSNLTEPAAGTTFS